MRLRDLLDAILPVECAACGALAGDGALVYLCASCQGELPRHPWPMASPVQGVRSAWYLVPYQGLGGKLIRSGKYGRRERLLDELSAYVGEVVPPGLPPVDMVTAVPSPRWRLLDRGFSGPEMMARAIARAGGLPHVRALRRFGGNPQAGLPLAERRRNVEGTVRAARALEGGPVVLLVDDVLTTGATASVCAEALLLGGARVVHLFTFASAMR